MSEPSAVVLIPNDIEPSMVAAGTSVPLVDSAAGEVAWNPDTTFTVGKRVNHDHSIWESTGSSTNVTPGSDGTKWLRYGPSNRMAPFDDRQDTKAVGTGSMTFVIQPGFFTGLSLWGLLGDRLQIAIYDKPGGIAVEEYDGDMYEQALGLFELLFMPLRQRTQHYMSNLPLYPDAEVHVTISASGNGPVAVGLIALGHWDTLLGTGDAGGVEYGGNAAVKSYSYRRLNDDGTVKRERRGSSTNVSCTVLIDAKQGNHAMELLHRAQGKAVAVIVSGLPQYDYLNGVADLSGDLTPINAVRSRLSLKMEGILQ